MTIKNMLVPVGDIERDEGAIGTALFSHRNSVVMRNVCFLAEM